jgi:hypothetical protein
MAQVCKSLELLSAKLEYNSLQHRSTGMNGKWEVTFAFIKDCKRRVPKDAAYVAYRKNNIVTSARLGVEMNIMKALGFLLALNLLLWAHPSMVRPLFGQDPKTVPLPQRTVFLDWSKREYHLQDCPVFTGKDKFHEQGARDFGFLPCPICLPAQANRPSAEEAKPLNPQERRDGIQDSDSKSRSKQTVPNKKPKQLKPIPNPVVVRFRSQEVLGAIVALLIAPVVLFLLYRFSIRFRSKRYFEEVRSLSEKIGNSAREHFLLEPCFRCLENNIIIIEFSPNLKSVRCKCATCGKEYWAAAATQAAPRLAELIGAREEKRLKFAHLNRGKSISVECIFQVQEAALPFERTTREPITKDIRAEVWRRDGGQCVQCNSKENLEFDHIIPVSKGGATTARNLQLLCSRCNRKKSASIWGCHSGKLHYRRPIQNLHFTAL